MKKPQDIQVEESLIIWKLKALHVVLKFHIGMLIPLISKLKKLLKKRVNGLHEIKRLVWRILVSLYAILQKQKPQELYYVQQRNHFQIKGIATTKELWIGTVKFNHLNLFSDQLNDNFHTFSYK